MEKGPNRYIINNVKFSDLLLGSQITLLKAMVKWVTKAVEGLLHNDSTCEHNILLLDKILHSLEANGFEANQLICERVIQEMDWLGYWLMLT